MRPILACSAALSFFQILTIYFHHNSHDKTRYSRLLDDFSLFSHRNSSSPQSSTLSHISPVSRSMPPKAQGGRRQSARNPRRDSDASSSSAFAKPNLPDLRGTPSARRQYSYGAGAEPAPTRQGSKSKGVFDLSNAVRDAMSRHDDEEGSDRTRTRSSSAMDPDQDELAGGSNMPCESRSRCYRECTSSPSDLLP